jgi:glycosyltransferase involved in cell wall biosynthesis
MAKNALAILKDENTLKRFKANSLQRARHFNLENIMEQYVAVYQNCLSAQNA